MISTFNSSPSLIRHLTFSYCSIWNPSLLFLAWVLRWNLRFCFVASFPRLGFLLLGLLRCTPRCALTGPQVEVTKEIIFSRQCLHLPLQWRQEISLHINFNHLVDLGFVPYYSRYQFRWFWNRIPCFLLIFWLTQWLLKNSRSIDLLAISLVVEVLALSI